MKVFVLSILLVGIVSAGNPDERTSMTFLVGADFWSGKYTLTDDWGVTAKQDTKLNRFGGSVKLIMPQSDNISLIGVLSYTSVKSEGEATIIFFDSEHKTGGLSIAGGIKIYFPK